MVQEIVLSYPKLKERIESRKDGELERKKALSHLHEIKAQFSKRTIQTFVKFLDGALPKLYDDINFNDSNVHMRELLKDKCVVLVPNHQSHADYLALNYLFYKNYRAPLYVAGGINLNIFPIGTLFRKSGCFFIRRSFASDITYKLTLEAYLYYLLKMGRPIEFFFEGGRSRTGRLSPPRFGLYNMLIEAHRTLMKEKNSPLVFIPVSLVHEYVPEQRTLTHETLGAKKRKESSGQLLRLLGLFTHQFGSMHLRLGRPLEVRYPKGDLNSDDVRKITQDLAFKCFREVGRNMMVTPTSLLSLVLLDGPTGALIWQDILAKALVIMDFCWNFHIPHSENLRKASFEKGLERAMDVLIGNGQIQVIGREERGHNYYLVKEGARQEILYFKNTILHHFLVPAIIGDVWVNLFSGEINTEKDLKSFLLHQRRQLRHDFYLPTVKEFFFEALTMVSKGVGRRIGRLEDLMGLSKKELYGMATQVGIFSRSLSFIIESHYIAGLALLELGKKKPEGFKREAFRKLYGDIHAREKTIGKFVKYRESYSVPAIKGAWHYFHHSHSLQKKQSLWIISDRKLLQSHVQRIEKNLRDQLVFNMRAWGEAL